MAGKGEAAGKEKGNRTGSVSMLIDGRLIIILSVFVYYNSYCIRT